MEDRYDWTGGLGHQTIWFQKAGSAGLGLNWCEALIPNPTFGQAQATTQRQLTTTQDGCSASVAAEVILAMATPDKHGAVETRCLSCVGVKDWANAWRTATGTWRGEIRSQRSRDAQLAPRRLGKARYIRCNQKGTHGFFLRQGDGRCMDWTIWEGHRGSSINIRVAWRWDSVWNQQRKRVSDTSEGI